MSTPPSPAATVVHGNSLDHLRTLPDDSIDAVICDPPYGLSNTRPAQIIEAVTHWASGDRAFVPAGRGFMSAAWDSFVPPPAIWDECFRVLKPGGHLAAFAGSRTHDLMTLSIRFAGFDIRDQLAWIYGSGMSHGQDISTSIAKQGDESAARRWQGWNTGLKPAIEPIVLARKPLSESSVARNVLTHGTGALNVGATHIAHRNAADVAESTSKNQHADFGTAPGGNSIYGDFTMVASKNYDGTGGRHPANVLLSHDPLCTLVTEGTVSSSSSSAVDAEQDEDARRSGAAAVEVWECAPGCQVAELDRQSGTTKSSGGHGVGYEGTGPTYGAYAGMQAEV